MPDGERESLERSQGSWCLPQRGDASVLSSSSRQVLNSGIRKPGVGFSVWKPRCGTCLGAGGFSCAELLSKKLVVSSEPLCR